MLPIMGGQVAEDRVELEAGALVSSSVPDWARERLTNRLAWEPGKQLLSAIRSYQSYGYETDDRIAKLRRMESVARYRFWSAVTGADIPLNSQLGGGLLLPHPNGIVIHPDAVIGPNCLLFQQVTLGKGPKPGFPYLEGHVDVGAGAKILGGVRIGAHAIIGANAVVLEDVPAGATVVGVPGRVIKVRATERQAG